MSTLTIETITPDEAQKMLDLNTNNRPIRQVRVHLYASEMKADRWLLTGEPIIFNGTNLINGQHRLAACVYAGVPFTTAVFRGAADEVYQVIDSGLARTAGDVLKHEGIPHYNATASAARLVLGYNANVLHDSQSWTQVSSRPLILDEVTQHAAAYEHAAHRAWQARQDGYNVGSFIAITILLSRLIGQDETVEWMDGAVSGVGLESGDPRLALRRWILGIRGGTGPVHLSAWIRARNAYVKNESRTLIKSWFKGTAFPRLVEEST